MQRSRMRVAVNTAVSLSLVAIGIRTAPELLVGLSIAAAVGVSVEILAPLHEGRRSARSYVLDLTHALGDRAVIVPLVAVLVGIAEPAIETAFPSSFRAGFGSLPWAVQVAVTVVATDFANYLIHRSLHRVGFLWAFHSVHHSSERLDWLATSRVHPVDLAVNISVVTLPTIALGQVELVPWLVTFFFVYPFVTHANARVRLGAVGTVVVTPAFHHWHHAAADEAHDRNFGMFLSVWDRLFGTAITTEEYPSAYGIESSDLDDLDFIGQMTQPFGAARAAVLAR